MISYATISIVLIWLMFLVFLLFKRQSAKNDHRRLESYPYVSILIPLRNEESNIQALCKSLNALSYPKSNFEILIADDNSDDNTLALLHQNKPENASIYSAIHMDSELIGKSRVLSFLGKKAKGEYFLFTDGDMSFHPDWVQSMISQSTGEGEIVVGFTEVKGAGLASRMQNLDWLFNEWIVSRLAGVGFYLAAWGNNMLIARNTYNSIGGYEKLGQTIVEDVSLLRAVVEQKGKLVVNSELAGLASTQPSNKMIHLLHQRKRWMTGLKGLSPLWILGYMIKMLFWPGIILLSLINPFWSLAGFIAIILRTLIWNKIPSSGLKEFSKIIVDVVIFEIYDFVFYLITFVFYILPIQTIWKGRKY